MLWFWAYLVPIPLMTISVQCNRDLVVVIQSHQAFSHSLRIPGVCSLDKHNDSRVLAVQFCACYPELCWPSSCAHEDGKLVIKSFFDFRNFDSVPVRKSQLLNYLQFEGTLLRSVATTQNTCRMQSTKKPELICGV